MPYSIQRYGKNWKCQGTLIFFSSWLFYADWVKVGTIVMNHDSLGYSAQGC